jgi:large subunit ribosomal protein L31
MNLFAKEDPALKDKIHPQFHEATVTCACGNSFVTGSTKKTLKVDVCSKCHPFFTGVQKIVDTTGRLERFTKKFGLDKKEL